jgi:hypothetical protein
VGTQELRDRLRALELPPVFVEQIVVARIRARLRTRQLELLAAAFQTAPLWKQAAMKSERFSILTPEQRKELRDLEAEVRDETLRLLGPGPLDRSGNIAFKYGFVSPAKAVLLDALDRDYENLGTRLKDDTRNLTLPEDREREKFLKAEQLRDLTAMLTPAELDAYEMRVSPTAQNAAFQSHMQAFQPTEEEYRALFAVQKTFDRKRADPAFVAGLPAAVSPAGATMGMMSGPTQPEDEIKAVLSPERFADWELSNQGHYQSLARLARTNAIPDITVKQVATLLSQTSEESWKIADDVATTPAQKKTALADLAASTRAQVTAQLGAAGDSYLKSVRWFDAIAAGNAVKLGSNLISYRSVEPPPPRQ